MTVVANRRSVMMLYSDPMCPHCHAVRFVLAEKSVSFEIIPVDPDNKPEDLIELNPYNNLPTLVDRDLVLYGTRVIMEYLDERFPHPPLLPVDPVSRARSRLFSYRVEHDWYGLLGELGGKADKKAATKARKLLRERLIATAPVFAAKPFFMSDEFTLVDCGIAPLLWRLPLYGIDLRTGGESVLEYAQRIFERESFRASMSEAEREIREEIT